jgi:RimJ/RimL family protein N-acetyltransferase
VGKGIGLEAMEATLAWFDREHGPRRVVCMISLGNAPSVRLAEKLGFTPLREGTLPTGETVDLFERPPSRPARRRRCAAATAPTTAARRRSEE